MNLQSTVDVPDKWRQFSQSSPAKFSSLHVIAKWKKINTGFGLMQLTAGYTWQHYNNEQIEALHTLT